MKERKPVGYWQDWSNVEVELKKVIEILGHFPSQPELAKLKRTDIHNAIYRYHGNLTKACKRMGHKENRRPPGYWNKWDNVKREVKSIVKEQGSLPGQHTLERLGYSELVDAVNRHYGGFSTVRKKLKLREVEKPKRYWRRWENVEGELVAVIKEVGHFPVAKELEDMNRSSLSHAIINYYGGYETVRKRLEEKGIVKSEKGDIEDLLRGYINS